MTSARTRANIILGSGASTVTVYTMRCEKLFKKTIIKITPPQSSSNWGSGPKDTKIVDLLTIETRFNVTGMIASTDQSALESLLTSGGSFNMAWESTSSNYDINIEKLQIIEDTSKGEQDEMEIMFTAIVGIDI